MQKATGAGCSSSRVSGSSADGRTTSSSSSRCRRRVRAVRTQDSSQDADQLEGQHAGEGQGHPVVAAHRVAGRVPR